MPRERIFAAPAWQMTLAGADHITLRAHGKPSSPGALAAARPLFANSARHGFEAMEFNKIAGAILVTLLAMMAIAKIGNTLVPPFYPPTDKPGHEGPGPTGPQTTEPEKPVAELLAAADPKAGEKRAQACVSCHSFDKGGAKKVGPNLWDIVGRKKGSHADYDYSPGLKGAGGEWTYEDLFKYLANPGAMINGSKMAFRLTGATQRAEVLAYLRTLSDSPKPLPAVEKKPEPPAPPKPEPGKGEEPKKPDAPGEPPKPDEKKN
jgi:cytochrome c